jgi:hypothetical protein
MNVRITQGLLAIVALLLATNLVAPFGTPGTASAQSSAQVPDVLRARLIELVAPDGKVVAQLHAGEDGSGQLRLRSAGGEVRVKLGPSSSGSSLILMDANTEPAVWLATNRDGTSITLAEAGKEKLVLAP